MEELNVYQKKKIRTYEIVDNLLEKFKFTIKSDTFENDIRKIFLNNSKNNNVIFITSTIIFDDNFKKKECEKFCHMNLSRYSKNMLFAPFSAYFRVASWSRYSSMSCEAVSKSDKKCIKNQMLRIGG
jgi:predicted HNH restriction endonuclease